MTDLRSSLILSADARGLKGELRQARGELDRLGGGTRRAGEAGRRAGADFQRMGGGARTATQQLLSMRNAAASLGIALGGAQAIRSIAGFGEAMSTVRAITQATEAQFAALTAEAQRLGSTTRFSATQAADAMTFLARAGFEVEEVLAGVGPALRLAQAGALELGSAADIASNILTAFRLDVSEFSRVVDVLAKGANSANTNVGQLGEAVKFVGPVAAGVNVPLEEVVATVGALSDAGLQASLAGTGLRGVIAELESPSAKTQAVLRSLGLTAADVAVSQVGLTGALERLAEAGITTGQALEVFGNRAGPAAEVIVNAVPRVRELDSALQAAGGTAERIARQMDDNLGGSLKAVASASEAVVLALGELGAESALRSLFDGLADGLRAVAANADILVTAAELVAVVVGARLANALAVGAGRALLQFAAANAGAVAGLRLMASVAPLTAARLVAVGTAAGVARAAMLGLTTLLGGPLGIALAAASAAFVLLGDSTSAAADVARQYREAGLDLNEMLERQSGLARQAADEQDALGASMDRVARRQAEQRIAGFVDTQQDAGGDISRLLRQSRAQAFGFAGADDDIGATQAALRRLQEQFESGQISARELAGRIDRLAESGNGAVTRLADRLTRRGGDGLSLVEAFDAAGAAADRLRAQVEDAAQLARGIGVGVLAASMNDAPPDPGADPGAGPAGGAGDPDELARKFRRLEEALDPAVKRTRELAEARDLLDAATDAELVGEDRATELFRALTDQSGRAAEILARMRGESEQLVASLDPAIARQQELAAVTAGLTQAESLGVISRSKKNALLAEATEEIMPTAAQFLARINEQVAEEARLAGLSNIEREVEIRLRQILNEAREEDIELSDEQIAQLRETIRLQAEAGEAADNRRRMEERAAREIEDIWMRARQSVQASFADAIDDILGGETDGIKAFWKSFADVGRRAVAETLSARVFGAAGGGAGGLLGGLLGGGEDGAPRDPLSGLSRDFKAIFGDGDGALGRLGETLKGGLDSIGQSLGFDNIEGAFSSALEGAGTGAAVAGIGNALGLGLSGTGSALGGAIGNLTGVPGGGLIGSVLGGIVGSLFGKTPQASAAVTSSGATDIFTRGKGEADTARSLADALVQSLGSIAASGGGSVTGGLGLGVIGQKGDEFFFNALASDADKRAGKAKGGAQFFETADEAVLAAIRSAISGGVFSGLSDTVSQIIRTSSATTVDQFLSDVAFGETFEELVNVGRQTTEAEKALANLNRTYDQAIARARELGLSEARLEQARGRAIEQLRDDFEASSRRAILEIEDPVRAALERQREAQLQLLREADALGADITLIERRIALERRTLLEDLESDLNRAFRQMSADIDSFVNEIRFGASSALSPADQLAEAQARFDDLLARARGGDEEAATEIVDAARTLRELQRDRLASSEAFFDFEDFLLRTLDELRQQFPRVNIDQAAAAVPVARLDDAVLNDIGQEIADGNQMQENLLQGINDRLDALLAQGGLARPGGGVAATGGGAGGFFASAAALRSL